MVKIALTDMVNARICQFDCEKINIFFSEWEKLVNLKINQGYGTRNKKSLGFNEWKKIIKKWLKDSFEFRFQTLKIANNIDYSIAKCNQRLIHL